MQQPTPPAPPIPVLPARPGTSTAPAPAQAPAAGDAAQAAANADQAVRNAEQALQNAVEAQLNAARAQEGATQTEIVVPPPYRSDNEIPKEVIPILAIVFGSLTMIILGYPIIRFVTRMIERRTDRTVLPASEVTAQLKTLQDSLDTMAIEIERISEAQRFQAKLLADRERAALPEARGGA